MADPILITPGQVVASPDWDALVAQHGGVKSVQARAPTAEETAAASKAAAAAAPVAEGEDPVPDDPRTWYIRYQTNPVYRYYFADGSYAETRTAPNGTDSQVVDYKPSQKATQAAAAQAKGPPGGKPFEDDDEKKGASGRRWGWNPDTQAYDRDLGPSPAAQGIGVSPQAQQGVAIGTREQRDNAGNVTKVTTYRRPDGSTYDQTDTVTQEPKPPQVVPGTLNTTSPRYGVMDPTTGQITWVENPNYQKPDPKAIPLPANQKWVIWDNGDGTTRTEKNPNYTAPSKIERDPATGRYIQITEDDEGKPVIRPVTTETVVKPSDLPVLQARFGEVAQGLGNLAQDLNGRVARGEMTPEERTQAFTAAHQQAQVQVNEINNILENSRAAWASAISQRGQTLGETASRRSYASSIFGGALSAADAIARSSGPGHGAAIARGMGALMNMGQRYAEGMGGFRESPEVPMPTSLQQVQGIGIPGYGPAATGGGAGAPAGPQASGAGGASADAAAAEAERQRQAAAAAAAPSGPAAANRPWADINTGPSILPWAGGATPPASTQPFAGQAANPTLMGGGPPGQNPIVAQMAQRLMAGGGSMGAPVAAGGPGVFDLGAETDAMLTGDPAWDDAVRRAAAAQAGNGWRRFA